MMCDMKIEPGISWLYYKHPDDSDGTVLTRVIAKLVDAIRLFYPHYTLVHTLVLKFSK
jgi:hypothetical protein